MTIYKNIEFPLTNLQVEVPLVTFFNYELNYTYKMRPTDVQAGIVKSIKSLANKCGFNKKQFDVKTTLGEDGLLNIQVKLNAISPTAKNMFKENMPKIVNVNLKDEKEAQASDALFDTNFRATVNHIADDEMVEINVKGRLGKAFNTSMIDETISGLKNAANHAGGKAEETVITKTQHGYEIMGRVIALPHKRLQECIEAVKAAYAYETFGYSITKIISKELTNHIKNFLKDRGLLFSDYKIYFDKTNVKVFFKLLRASEAQAEEALGALASELNLSDVEKETAQAVAHRNVTLHRTLRDIRGLDIFLDPLDHRRRVFVFIRCRRDVPHLSSNLRHVDRPLIFKASVHLALHKPHNRGQPLIQHVSVVRIFIVAHSITNEPTLLHAHASINIVWFSVNRHANLDGSFLALRCPVAVVKYQ